MEHLLPTVKPPSEPEAYKAFYRKVAEHNKEFKRLLDEYLAKPSLEAAKRLGGCARQGRKDGLRSQQR